MNYGNLALPATIISLLFFGLITGFFYAYSVDVMRGFNQLPPLEAIRAMQAINTAVQNPVFFATFFLTPVIGALTAVILYKTGSNTSALYVAFAVLVYLLGAFLPTIAVNVPMNETLAALNTADQALDARPVWEAYSAKWTNWNTARTIGSLLSLALVGMALSALNRV